MDVKRYFRGPVMWIVLAVLAVVVLMQVVGSSGGYKTVDTGKVIQAISKNQVEQAKLTTGDEQILKIELKDKQKLDGESGSKFQASYIGNQGVELADTLQKKFESGDIEKGYTVSPSKQSPFVSILLSLLPFVLIVVVFLFLMNQMQGGGSKVMQFGKSKAKLITKDTPKTTFADVAGSDEAVEELYEIKEFLQERRSSRPSAPRSPRVSCCTGRPVRVRRCSLARSRVRRASRSTRSPVPTSSRCSSASVPPVSVTSSSRPRRTLRRSSSSTRSTPSGGTAVPAWAAVTTSASRRSTSCSSRWTAST